MYGVGFGFVGAGGVGGGGEGLGAKTLPALRSSALVRAMEAISSKIIAKDFIFSLVLISIEMKIVIKLHFRM